jgi:hypothetical protein
VPDLGTGQALAEVVDGSGFTFGWHRAQGDVKVAGLGGIDGAEMLEDLPHQAVGFPAGRPETGIGADLSVEDAGGTAGDHSDDVGGAFTLPVQDRLTMPALPQRNPSKQWPLGVLGGHVFDKE